jgi:undecaprenyl-diphosphatase
MRALLRSCLKPRPPSGQSLLLAGAVAAALAVGATLVAAGGTVGRLEADVFHAVNDLPDALRPLMWVFQLAGLVLLPVVVALVAALARRWWLALCLVLLVPLKLLVEKGVIKQLVDRQRPGVTVCHGDAGCAHFRGVPLEGPSYVSGHAIIAWSVATLLAPYLLRRGRIVVFAIALLNSLARVYLGAHNPLDVVGGAALGVLIGVLLHVAIRPTTRDLGPLSSATSR